MYTVLPRHPKWQTAAQPALFHFAHLYQPSIKFHSLSIHAAVCPGLLGLCCVGRFLHRRVVIFTRLPIPRARSSPRRRTCLNQVVPAGRAYVSAKCCKTGVGSCRIKYLLEATSIL